MQKSQGIFTLNILLKALGVNYSAISTISHHLETIMELTSGSDEKDLPPVKFFPSSSGIRYQDLYMKPQSLNHYKQEHSILYIYIL